MKTSNLRSYVLPSAIVFGLLLHRWCAELSFVVPYLIFSILMLSYSAADLKKIRLGKLDWSIMAFQICVSLGGYALIKGAFGNDIVAEGFMCGVLCPVASSVAVVSCMLGANRERVTTYTIAGNLMVALVAPVVFSFIGTNQHLPFAKSLMQIFAKIAPTIMLPFFVVLLLDRFFPKAKKTIGSIQGVSFYLWALTLLLTLGKTIDFVFIHGEGNWHNIVWLGVLSVLACAVQFAFGKQVGEHFGDRVAGGQLMAQKNTAVGIWMANTYLNPLSAVFLAFYAVWQNLFNSWQLWRKERRG